ncbi:MAG: DNA mismatch endonuclease Vsr [Clostridia bacterium]|nr:DNA mismatch endonuclease Vsr [Clostridia bacterium]
MDNRSKEARSRNMAHIPSKGTKPEEYVRKYLFKQGFRYRKNVSDLPGKPDIVLPKFKTVVFINGCFWHCHEGCRWFVPPKTNTDFWRAKFKYNIERDRKNYARLEEDGWRVLIIWECEIRHGDPIEAVERLIKEIKGE